MRVHVVQRVGVLMPQEGNLTIFVLCVMHQFVMGILAPYWRPSGILVLQCWRKSVRMGRGSSDRKEVRVRVVCFPDARTRSRYRLSDPFSIPENEDIVVVFMDIKCTD